jgi:hypothetical protein
VITHYSQHSTNRPAAGSLQSACDGVDRSKAGAMRSAAGVRARTVSSSVTTIAPTIANLSRTQRTQRVRRAKQEREKRKAFFQYLRGVPVLGSFGPPRQKRVAPPAIGT